MNHNPQENRNQQCTIYVGSLAPEVTETILWELMIQAGPLVNVHIPKDKISGQVQGFGFVEFKTEEDAAYAALVMNMVRLYGRSIKVNRASADKKIQDIGANLFIGNLAPEVDEKLLYDTFSAFGCIINNTPKVMRDVDTSVSKGFAFVNYDNFESSDAAIEAMRGQFFCGRNISVQYAFKRESRERHGGAAERLIAKTNPISATTRKPHSLFAAGPLDRRGPGQEPAQEEAGALAATTASITIPGAPMGMPAMQFPPAFPGQPAMPMPPAFLPGMPQMPPMGMPPMPTMPGQPPAAFPPMAGAAPPFMMMPPVPGMPVPVTPGAIPQAM
eukprot:TRINITY_DN2940_c0_g1_i2.p1 TRINITY_DN2940_c0_g1~~TRINITY_DN2940_c0_g1_i2.p1  ORF type:complete len:346 (-),score=68.27 TRINITY_DN2940_c0_g1_i2:21-1010(-)